MLTCDRDTEESEDKALLGGEPSEIRVVMLESSALSNEESDDD